MSRSRTVSRGSRLGLPVPVLALMGLGLVFLHGSVASAQDSKKLVVGTKQAAPFSFRGDGEPWQGISIDLWRGVAKDLGIEFEFREATLDELIDGLSNDRLDISIGALTVTAEREQEVDFTHPFYPSGLGIAVPAKEAGSAWAGLKRFLSVGFFQAAGTLALVLFIGGAVL